MENRCFLSWCDVETRLQIRPVVGEFITVEVFEDLVENGSRFAEDVSAAHGFSIAELLAMEVEGVPGPGERIGPRSALEVLRLQI